MENEMKEKANKIYGLGVTSFVLSILSIITMCYVVFSVLFGTLAVILGILSCIIEKKNGMGVAGLIIGGVSLIITLVMFIVLGVMDIDLLYIPEYYRNFI